MISTSVGVLSTIPPENYGLALIFLAYELFLSHELFKLIIEKIHSIISQFLSKNRTKDEKQVDTKKTIRYTLQNPSRRRSTRKGKKIKKK